MKVASAVKFTKFSLYYGELLALKDITINIPRKKVTAIIGPPGCGKSSFLRAINRLNDFLHASHYQGEIHIGDECITAPDFNRLFLNGKTAMFTTNNSLIPGTVLDNLLHNLRVSRKDVKKNSIVEYLEKHLEPYGLWKDFRDYLPKNAYSLSCGAQRLLCLAQLLLPEPDIMLLDEPTLGLGRDFTLRFEEIVPRLKKNMTVVLATQNNRQATILSDFIAFLYDGELVETGETMKFFSRPAQRRTEDYISRHYLPKKEK